MSGHSVCVLLLVPRQREAAVDGAVQRAPQGFAGTMEAVSGRFEVLHGVGGLFGRRPARIAEIVSADLGRTWGRRDACAGRRVGGRRL